MDEGNQVFPQSDSAALVVIEFPSFRDFIDAYSPIISEAGIFIRNADISESNAFSVGDPINFEVRLKDDFRLIQGAGEVAWLGSAEAADGAMGTAIRFRDVDEPSQRLIARLVGNYLRDGGKLFEIGASEALPAPEPEVDVEEEVDSGLPLLADELPVNPQLTAENLKASEAQALFADDSEADPTTLEFESVSPDDVRPGVSETPDLGDDQTSDGVGVSLDDPVGLETIAIPSALMATLASEEEQAEAVQGQTDAGAGESLPDGVGAPSELELSASESLPEALELPPIGDSVPGAESVLQAAKEGTFAELPEPLEIPLAEEFDEASLKSAAGPMDADVGGLGRIPDDIAQVAEELSGVHRYDLPKTDEASGVTYAGSASVASERNTGGRIAALAVAAVLLGAGAFYFGDTILGLLGLGAGEDGEAPTEIVQVEETTPAAMAPAAGDSVESTTSVGGDGVETEPGAEAQGSDSASEPSAADSTAVAGDGTAPVSSDPPVAPVSDLPVGAGSASRTVSDKPKPRSESAAVVSAPAAETADSVRRVERITWREEGDSTVVTIRLNVELSNAYFEVVRIRDGAPREVIKIQGVEVPYSPSEVAIGSSHLLRLRTGLHRESSGSVLHVVADLTSAGVSILSVEPKGRDLEITFS